MPHHLHVLVSVLYLSNNPLSLKISDDFQDSPGPPTKKCKLTKSKPQPKQQERKIKTKEPSQRKERCHNDFIALMKIVFLSLKKLGVCHVLESRDWFFCTRLPQTRLSVEDKIYQRELEAALEASRKESSQDEDKSLEEDSEDQDERSLHSRPKKDRTKLILSNKDNNKENNRL